MLISVVNHTNGKLSDERCRTASAPSTARSRTISGHTGTSRRSCGWKARRQAADDEKLPELRGDAIIYLWDGVTSTMHSGITS